MSEENVVTAVDKPTNTVTEQVQQGLQNSIWGNPPIVNVETKLPDTNQDTPPPLIDVPKEWLKKEFDIDDVAILKAEREELRNIKANPPKAEQIKFADDESRHIYELLKEGGDKKKEVRKFLETQEKLETFISSEINESNAADIVKLHMGLKSKDLTSKEIDYKFNKEFGLPKEPQLDTYDEESVAAHNEWKEKVADIKMNLNIEAKLAKPYLEKAQSELVLPEINKGSSAKQNLTPEEMAEFDEAKKTFVQSAQQTIDVFNGFTAQVKDKDVDYSVSYTPSQEEKNQLSNKLNDFAESGFDANVLFIDRWLKEDGKTINIQQMTEDMSRIFMGKNSDQKLAVEAANKRIESFLKDKRNISITDGNRGSTYQFNETQTTSEKLAEKFFA